MTKELLQQALDALMQVCPHSDSGVKQHNDAIVALQGALAQPAREHSDMHLWLYGNKLKQYAVLSEVQPKEPK